MANDLLDFVFFLSINRVRGWHWEVLAVDFIFVIRRQEGHVEDQVDLPGLGQAELIDDRGQDLCDSKWSFPFGGEFWVVNWAFQVSGFQPDFVSFDEWFEALSRPGRHDLSG